MTHPSWPPEAPPELGVAIWHPVPSWPDPWPTSPVPAQPLAYHQLLRGPRARWWKPFVSFLLLIGLLGVALAVIFTLGDLVFAGTSDEPFGRAFSQGIDLEGFGPLAELVGDLALAVLIPVTMLATWWVHRVRPGFVSSVAGRIRWRWLLRCSLVLLPLWLVYLAVGYLADPPALGRPEGWGLLLVLALVATPFQAAGEEYLFRGWLVQNVGSFFRRPVVGWVVSTLCSAGLFAAAHGSFDPYVFGDIAALAVAACYLNWRTGGLETGIALHVVNNVTVGLTTVLIGGYAESYVDESTTGSPLQLTVSVVVLAIATATVLWQLRRHPVQRLGTSASTALRQRRPARVSLPEPTP